MKGICLGYYKKKIEQLKKERVIWKRIKRAKGNVINLPQNITPEIAKAIKSGTIEEYAEGKKQDIQDKINYYEDKIYGGSRISNS